jgi:hypothetical protein
MANLHAIYQYDQCYKISPVDRIGSETKRSNVNTSVFWYYSLIISACQDKHHYKTEKYWIWLLRLVLCNSVNSLWWQHHVITVSSIRELITTSHYGLMLMMIYWERNVYHGNILGQSLTLCTLIQHTHLNYRTRIIILLHVSES